MLKLQRMLVGHPEIVKAGRVSITVDCKSAFNCSCLLLFVVTVISIFLTGLSKRRNTNEVMSERHAGENVLLG